MYLRILLLVSLLMAHMTWALGGYRDDPGFEVTGKVALAINNQGIRMISGHFAQIRGQIGFDGKHYHSDGKGKVLIRLDSWEGRSGGESHPIVALTGERPRRYGVIEIETVSGLQEAELQPGVPVSGRIIGSFSLDRKKDNFSAPVHIIALSENHYVIQALAPVSLSRKDLGLRGSGDFDDQLKTFFRLELVANEY